MSDIKDLTDTHLLLEDFREDYYGMCQRVYGPFKENTGLSVIYISSDVREWDDGYRYAVAPIRDLKSCPVYNRDGKITHNEWRWEIDDTNFNHRPGEMGNHPNNRPRWCFPKRAEDGNLSYYKTIEEVDAVIHKAAN